MAYQSGNSSPLPRSSSSIQPDHLIEMGNSSSPSLEEVQRHEIGEWLNQEEIQRHETGEELNPEEVRRREIKKELSTYEDRLTESIDNLLQVETRWEDGRPPHTVNGYVKELATFREKKRLFVCCDGTWKNASGTIAPLTNVAKLARCVDRIGNDELDLPTERSRLGSGPGTRFGLVRQLVYYSSGVGTQSSLPPDSGFAGVTGHGVTANILSAYCFICNNYNFGSTKDDIILVGFSRGAFTVRCLAAFISKVGLLRRKGLPFLHLLFDHWRRQKTEELERFILALNQLRYSDVRIKVLAEWDPVSAMGLPLGFWKRELSFVDDKVPAVVDNAFLAIALNEKRPSFKPLHWRTRSDRNTKVKQCGFMGSHSDVGGGNPDAGLSTVSLLWMISQISEVCSARFDSTALLQFLTPLQSSLLGNERPLVSGTNPKLRLKNLSSTEGHVHESLTCWWLAPKYLSLGLWRGERHVMIDQLAQKEGEPRDCDLTIHFTARLIAKDKDRPLRCGFFKRYKPEENGTSIRWVPQEFDSRSETTPPTSFLPEECLSPIERDLLRKWLKQAKSWWKYEREKSNPHDQPNAQTNDGTTGQVGGERIGGPAGESTSESAGESARGSSSASSSMSGDTPGFGRFRGRIDWEEFIEDLDLGYVSGCQRNKSLIYLIRSELRELRRREIV